MLEDLERSNSAAEAAARAAAAAEAAEEQEAEEREDNAMDIDDPEGGVARVAAGPQWRSAMLRYRRTLGRTVHDWWRAVILASGTGSFNDPPL